MSILVPKSDSIKILVLGSTGMLGHVVFQVLSEKEQNHVIGTIRHPDDKRFFEPSAAERLIHVEDIENHDHLERLFDYVEPQVVVNCTSIGKPIPTDPMRSIAILSVLPYRLARLCRLHGARLVQIGSDGVFAGTKGQYAEDDFPDATDLYGTAKQLGEVKEQHTVLLRTSMIGHELKARSGLVEWFLSQSEECRCFTRAIFSGLPTVVLAEIIRDHVIPCPDLNGIYHLAAAPISKFDLLRLIAERYEKNIRLIPDDTVSINRSLQSGKFSKATGYFPPAWPQLINSMYSYQFKFARK